MTKNKPTSKSTRRPATQYEAVASNIYHDGSSYRVRVSVNGTKYSKNFSSKKLAIQYRNQLLAA